MIQDNTNPFWAFPIEGPFRIITTTYFPGSTDDSKRNEPQPHPEKESEVRRFLAIQNEKINDLTEEIRQLNIAADIGDKKLMKANKKVKKYKKTIQELRQKVKNNPL